MYTVTYNYESGTGSPVSATFTVGGTPLTLPTPTRAGFVFAGWFTSLRRWHTGRRRWSVLHTDRVGDAVRALDYGSTYTVTYNYESGTGSPASATYTVGGSPLMLPTPTRTGFTFAGWFTASSGGTLDWRRRSVVHTDRVGGVVRPVDCKYGHLQP